MKQEEVNQQVRDGAQIRVASAKLREKILERAQRLIDGAQYVALSDLLNEINEIKLMLARMGSRGRRHAVAVSAEVARSVLIALLLIPDRQEKLPSDSTPVNSAEASAELERATDDARRLAHLLWGTEEATGTIESYNRELSKAENPQLVEQLLVVPRTDDALAYTATGGQLLNVPPAPKTLPSALPQVVELQIKTVDEDAGMAVVVVHGAANPDGPAMSGLFDRRVPLVFDSEAIAGLAKLLELAQVTDERVHARVGVERGLGSNGRKYDELRMSEIINESDVRQKIWRRLAQMNTVTGELAFDNAD